MAETIALTDEQVLRLRAYARGRKVERRLAERANIILMAAEGRENLATAAELEVSRHTVARWRKRFLKLGISGIERDAPRPGRSRRLNADEIVRRTTQEKPANATHWSTRTMARAVGVSEAGARRVWHAHGLKPHRVETFKVSNDPRFAEKLEDVIGLYLNPPAHGIVLSVDEKSQIQALDRTQPSLPMKKGRSETMTHDYKRHGTTTLFAALNTLDGTVLSQCRDRHTHEDWIAFLGLINKHSPPGKLIHVIADNYNAHKHPHVQRWLAGISASRSTTLLSAAYPN